MTLRRLLVAAPLALLVAVLAHLAGFGTDHVLGGQHGFTLLCSALGALFALAGSATLTVALGRPRSFGEAAQGLRGALPGAGELVPFTAWLAGGALAAFWGLELLEGHAPFASLWVVPIASLLALAVAAAARAATRWFARAGLALATLAREIALGIGPRSVRLEARSLTVHTRPRRGSRCGRAPPRLG